MEWIHVYFKHNGRKQLTKNEKIDLAVLAVKGEYLAKQFNVKKIINLGNPKILEIRNEIMKNSILLKEVKIKLMNKRKEEINGLDIIKKQLNIKQ